MGLTSRNFNGPRADPLATSVNEPPLWVEIAGRAVTDRGEHGANTAPRALPREVGDA